mmetsp:Transcript_26084/g.70662  ORF Transcript_26084/g.70662 Transcript_26084/m.70662 type:complete len:173 (+) Transcript_26084:237-755(+)|eukprot:CAMPEP_0202366128 /NCGR_PEP_ID=MMETSP1126-20121109/16864_1 /ASSEMBLY_ACC=CAM_ASM_000457 /TAXON_ID=3047 /ORGANISM="Dunaliella tertiolecta, Strain CCMP1320" /LENGTH=172 /DNA_ID=CAMNT_0048961117 /DNA_START=193 /DNA_END=711 /DNA_ORIENTATION=-
MSKEEEPKRRKLSEQIEECQGRWFKEAVCASMYEADPVQMGMVGSMLMNGYGCEPNAQEAAKWLYQASKRGCVMPSSYQLPKQPLPPPDVLKHLPPLPPSVQLWHFEQQGCSRNTPEADAYRKRQECPQNGLSLYKSDEMFLKEQMNCHGHFGQPLKRGSKSSSSSGGDEKE